MKYVTFIGFLFCNGFTIDSILTQLNSFNIKTWGEVLYSIMMNTYYYSFGSGITNKGNTCYINATLQVLFNSPYFSSQISSKYYNGAIPRYLQLFYNNFTSSKKETKSLESFLNSIWNGKNSFKKGEQADCGAFLLYIIEKCNLCLDEFTYRYAEHITCCTCNLKISINTITNNMYILDNRIWQDKVIKDIIFTNELVEDYNCPICQSSQICEL